MQLTESYITNKYYDGYNKVSSKTFEPIFKLNGESIGIDEKEYVNYIKPGAINELITGNGCIATLSYQLCEVKYNVEAEIERKEIENDSHYLHHLQLLYRYYIR